METFDRLLFSIGDSCRCAVSDIIIEYAVYILNNYSQFQISLRIMTCLFLLLFLAAFFAFSQSSFILVSPCFCLTGELLSITVCVVVVTLVKDRYIGTL